MAYITERDDKEHIVKKIFGEDLKCDLDSLAACFDVFNDAVTRQKGHYWGPITTIDGAGVPAPKHLLKIIEILKCRPEITRQEVHHAIGEVNLSSIQARGHVDSVINTSIQFLLMVDRPGWDGNTHMHSPHWTDLEPFDKFVERLFPRVKISERREGRPTAMYYRAIKAWKVEKRGKIRFRPTDNLADHLMYDRQEQVVLLFHHTKFLKAQLELSKGMDLEANVSVSLRSGLLPPRLVYETLSTLQDVLFRVGDDRSDELLENLSKSGFDGDCRAPHKAIREDSPNHFEYEYWGERLAQLHKLASYPQPNSSFARWLERNATERNALYVALLGLFLSVLFGLLGFIVGVIQTVLAYQALKLSQ